MNGSDALWYGALTSVAINIIGFFSLVVTLYFQGRKNKAAAEASRLEALQVAEQLRADQKQQADIVRQAVEDSERRLFEYHRLISEGQGAIQKAIAENTLITYATGAKADIALASANNTNEKIAQFAGQIVDAQSHETTVTIQTR